MTQVVFLADFVSGGLFMYSFVNDYSEGAHERIIEALTATNRVQTCGYGLDEYCNEARAILAALLQRDSDIHFLVGGTQTNFTVISAVLRPHQGVLSAATGHINVHESGAVEATGHKVIILPSEDGKLRAADVRAAVSAHYADDSAEHMVQPGMVYISHPTELGTIYSKAELTELHEACAECGLPLFLDGARLGCALEAEGSDVTLADLAALTDVFYIGGTKMGALFGEALVINNPVLGRDFRYILKQHGGMLAKGRLLGIQFAELFRDGLYFRLARHAVETAQKLKRGIVACGCPLAVDTVTNQIFPIIDKEVLAALREDFAIGFWEKYDDKRDVVRLCTSWATEDSMAESFVEKLKSAMR